MNKSTMFVRVEFVMSARMFGPVPGLKLMSLNVTLVPTKPVPVIVSFDESLDTSSIAVPFIEGRTGTTVATCV